DEELAEFQAAVKLGDKRRMEDELGDVLFVMANVARFYNIYPELALHQGNQKFIRRFQFIENELKQRGKNINDVSLEEMDKFWEKAKEKESKGMRLDKFLKISRLIRRRTLAKKVADQGRITVNGNIAKASTRLKVGDQLTIQFAETLLTIQVKDTAEHVRKDEGNKLYEVIKEEKINHN